LIGLGYFSNVFSFSTIGFGDLMPGNSLLTGRDGSQKKLIITSAYIIGGMALIAMSFNLGISPNYLILIVMILK
jgi:hypothetical protein